MNAPEAPHVDFGMYPFGPVRWAWDALWAAVHERAPWAPAQLAHHGDPHASWDDPMCVVTQICGGPYIDAHADTMRLIGAFDLDLPQANERPGYYRTVIVGSSDEPLSERRFDAMHAVANSSDSLSGWHSLRAATVGPGATWPGTVTFTGAHRDSVATLASGEADIASIDPWSLKFIESEMPDPAHNNVHRLGLGPLVPSPAVVVRSHVADGEYRKLRAAFAEAMSDRKLSDALAALHINGFVTLTTADYEQLRPLIVNAIV